MSRWLRMGCMLVLAAWAIGLAASTVRLSAWQDRLSGVLVQMRADTLLRDGAQRAGQGLDPSWYRRRALALLGAVEELSDDALWRWFIPGSWRMFDDLEERATARVAHAFGQVVTETIRRELERRAAGMTGMALVPATGALAVAQGCQAPQAGAAPGAPTLVPSRMPEYRALEHLLDQAGALDRAVASLKALRGSPAGADELRSLVRYALGAELSGSASRSLALFRATPDPTDPDADQLARRLSFALRCSVGRGMAALHARMGEHNPLLEAEDAAWRATRSGMFQVGADGDGPRGLARLRSTLAAIEQERALLASPAQRWLFEQQPGLGEEHDRLLARMAGIGLLGPDMAQAARAQAQATRQVLQARVRAMLARPDSGLTWRAAAGRFELTPRRAALRSGLVALLEAPFIASPWPGDASSPQDLATLVAQRDEFLATRLSLFPPSQREPAARWVEARVAAVSLARARQWLQAAADPGAPAPDPQALLQRMGAAAEALSQAGEPALAQWVMERLGQEVFSCDPVTTACPPPSPHAPSGSEAAPAAPASSSGWPAGAIRP